MATTLYSIANTPANAQELPPNVIAANVVQGVASAIAFSSIAVSWHRYILRDEVPQGMQRLRMDGTVLRYIGNIVLIAIMLGAAGLLLTLIITVLTIAVPVLGVPLIFLLGIPAFLIMIVYSYRLSVKLPAIALERRDYSMNNALNDTRDNSWNILGMALLFVLLLLAAAVALFAVSYVLQLFGEFGAPAIILIQFGVNWVATILGVTMLTSLYGFFVENRDF
jgi:hypothetical protein